MSYSKFWKMFIAFIAAYCIIAICFNIKNNTYGVIKEPKKIMHGVFNDRYVKMNYLLKHKDDYDGFLFGTSRSQAMNTTILGPKVYNLGAAHTAPEEWLNMFNVLLENGVKPKTIYVSLDDWFYKNRLKDYKNALNWHLYSTSSIDRYFYLFKVLLQRPDKGDMRDLLKGVNDSETITEIGVNGRMIFNKKKLNDIESNLREYVDNRKFLKPTYITDYAEQEPIAIKQIAEMKKICDANGIEFVVFFNTIHATTYMRDDFALMKKAKFDLAQITDYYDFSGINFIAVNNRFWFETSHYLPRVADAELRIVKGDKLTGNFAEFGRFITKENVLSELEKEESLRNSYDSKKVVQYLGEINGDVPVTVEN